jgi:hypothetical protein
MEIEAIEAAIRIGRLLSVTTLEMKRFLRTLMNIEDFNAIVRVFHTEDNSSAFEKLKARMTETEAAIGTSIRDGLLTPSELGDFVRVTMELSSMLIALYNNFVFKTDPFNSQFKDMPSQDDLDYEDEMVEYFSVVSEELRLLATVTTRELAKTLHEKCRGGDMSARCAVGPFKWASWATSTPRVREPEFPHGTYGRKQRLILDAFWTYADWKLRPRLVKLSDICSYVWPEPYNTDPGRVIASTLPPTLSRLNDSLAEQDWPISFHVEGDYLEMIDGRE